MTKQEIEEFISKLDADSLDMCVYPEGQNIECCDCTLCRKVFFEKVRLDLYKEFDFL